MLEIDNPNKAVEKATEFVVSKETIHVGELQSMVNHGDIYSTEELRKERKRLSENGKVDHEDLWIATGKYTRGIVGR